MEQQRKEETHWRILYIDVSCKKFNIYILAWWPSRLFCCPFFILKTPLYIMNWMWNYVCHLFTAISSHPVIAENKVTDTIIYKSQKFGRVSNLSPTTSVFYFEITPSGNAHFIMKDKKRNRGYLSCLKDRGGEKNLKNLTFLKALYCRGNGARKASLELPIYSSLLTKSHCVGWSTECWMGSIHCSWFYDV